MFNRIWASKIAQVVIFSLFIAAPVSALDVVYLKNGDIIIGTLVGPVAGGVSYNTFGSPRTVPLESIASSEKNLAALSNTTVQVLLKDGSTIQGKITDYDEDIGLFLDISFGTLTIPGIAVEKIYDLGRRTKYNGSSYQIAGFGGLYWPLFSSSTYFAASWFAGADVEWALPLARGLYAGARAKVSGMDYTPDATIDYFMASICPVLTFKYLGWRMTDGFLSRIVPFASLGAGPVYISIEDPSAYPVNYGSISAEIFLAAGIDVGIYNGWVLNLEGNASLVLQAGSPFISAGAMLSVSYER